jgi:hypothetical protein
MYPNRFSHTRVGSVAWMQAGFDLLSTMQPETREYRLFRLALVEALHEQCILHQRWHLDIEHRLALDSIPLRYAGARITRVRLPRASCIELASFKSK